MASRAPVCVYDSLFGADEVITDWKPDDAEMCATLIASAGTREAAQARFDGIISTIQENL